MANESGIGNGNGNGNAGLDTSVGAGAGTSVGSGTSVGAGTSAGAGTSVGAGTSAGAGAMIGGEEAFREGFVRVEAEVRAVEEPLPINVDVPSVVTLLLGSMPEITALRAEIGKLPSFDLERFDKLRDYTLALAHTQAMYRSSHAPNDPLPGMSERLAEVRDVLLADATALAKRKLLDEARIPTMRTGIGYKNIAFDVTGLVELYLARWESIKDRTSVRQEELAEADRLARQVVNAVGLKEQGPAVQSAAAVLRQQAYTLVAKTYEDARRAITFLRYDEGDAEEIAPSLFAGRGGRGRAPAMPDGEAGVGAGSSASGSSEAGGGLQGGALLSGALLSGAAEKGTIGEKVPSALGGAAPAVGSGLPGAPAFLKN